MEELLKIFEQSLERVMELRIKTLNKMFPQLPIEDLRRLWVEGKTTKDSGKNIEIKPKKQRKKYNISILKEYCKNNNIVLIGLYEKITCDTTIVGCCITKNCDQNFSRKFKELLVRGPICKNCAYRIAKQNRRETFLRKYGATNAMEVEEFKKKAEETIKKNHGGKHHMQTEEVKEKTRKTCMDTYKDTCMFRTEHFKNKSKETMLDRHRAEHALQVEKFKKKMVNTMLDRHGAEHATQVERFKDKMLETNLKNHGGVHSSKSPEVEEKRRQTMLKNHGVEHASKSPEVEEKRRQTMLKNHGVEHPGQSPVILKKMLETNLKNHGGVHSSKSPDVEEKRRQTCQQRYKCDNPCQNQDIADRASKNSYKLKTYTFPSGNSRKYQGYENLAINELLILGYKENDIISETANVPQIQYIKPDNKAGYHYVDIYIKSENRCVEVKSTWTFEKKKEITFLKQKGAKEMGMKYEIWVYDGKGKRVQTYC
jgi:predicted Zn-ribbon and HTH transcriptional regulator